MLGVFHTGRSSQDEEVPDITTGEAVEIHLDESDETHGTTK